MENKELKNKDNELIKKFAGYLDTTLTADDEKNMKEDFEKKYVYTRHIYEYVPLTYYDEYKTIDEFIDFVKEHYLSMCENEEAEEYGREDLWEDIYNEYKVDFKNIYESWKDDFEEQKEKFLNEQDNEPTMKM